ncbi:MAG: aromatic amino acid lyase [Candidatus Alcyoniella australis]|nr:aromatic amino acid lyase [Candidatus Alcyoniella australis]
MDFLSAPRLCKKIRRVTLDGLSLNVEQIVAVARHRARVRIAPEARRRMDCCRALVDVLLERQAVVYGLTTGFGRLRDKIIEPEDVGRLQRNLIRSHACGVGEPLPEDVVRATMLLRANALCQGHSGIRAEVVQRLVQMLNDDIFPFIPAKGSVGASGDLAPLSHLALVLMGDDQGRVMRPRDREPDGDHDRGRFWSHLCVDDFERLPQSSREFERLAKSRDWKFRPIELRAKEGLALNNGTQLMAALGVLGLYDSMQMLKAVEIAHTASIEAQKAVPYAYDERLAQVRPQPFQLEVSRRIRGYIEGSDIIRWHLNSAYVNRAILRLLDAEKDLADLTKHSGEADAQVLLRCKSDIDQIAGRLREFLDSPARRYRQGLRLAQQSRQQTVAWEPEIRSQIRAFRLALSDTEQALTEVYRTMLARRFPPADKARDHVADALRDLAHSVPSAPPFQDDYSFRCIPQVVACAYQACLNTYEVLRIEINSATDNPLLFPPEPPEGFGSMSPAQYRRWLTSDAELIERSLGSVIGGGNFHGEPLAIILDYLAIALSELASISERRIAHLVDEDVSSGLPAFLVQHSGLNSGFMVPQYTAAALVSENKVLTHPASTDSIPTCAGSEDHVSMGPISARKCREVIDNAEQVIAIELLTAFQALHFRLPFKPGAMTRRLMTTLKREGVEFLENDRVLFPDIDRVVRLIRNGTLAGLAEEMDRRRSRQG